MARQRANTPPYVPRKGLRSVLDQLQIHATGDTITRDELHKRGVSAHLIYPAMAALRFLGILDQSDTLTGRHKAFSRDAPDLAAQAKVVKSAYSDFFDAVSLPMETLDAVRDRFQQVYELSDRVINSAFPLFQYLSQEADIALASQGTHAPIADAEIAPHPPAPAKRFHEDSEIPDEDRALLRMASTEGGSPEQGIRIRHTGYQIVLNLQVTKFSTEKDVIKMIKTAKRAIHLLKKAGDSHG